MIAEKNKVNLRQFDFSDIDKIIELLNHEYKTNFTRDWWKWKYELNPNGFKGEDGDIWVAESEDKIVAHYAIVPEKLRFQSKTLNIAQAVDAITDPDYRGRGLFSTMMKKVFSQAKKRYRLVYGFPAEISYKGSLRYGWSDLSPLPLRVKILDYDSYFRRNFGDTITVQGRKLFTRASSQVTRYSKNLFSRKTEEENVKIERVDSFSDDINAFWERASGNYGAILERTATFLNWRFSKHFGCYKILVGHTAKKGIVGYIVFKSDAKSVTIIDLITLPNEDAAMSKLIDAAISESLTPQVDCVQLCFPKWHSNEAILSRKGFNSPIRPILKKTYFPHFIYFHLTEEQPVPKTGEWFITYTDTDFM